MNDLKATEEANLVEIERLNQRGGRTMSFVDLIEAGTVSAELAGELAALVEAGATILTSAKRGGVGKSTLLADLLACLPPGERIVTTPNRDAVERALATRDDTPTCFLAHEIAAGPWYAYLWGGAAADFFALARGGARVASSIHADELEDLYDSLASQEADARDVHSIGIVAFMRRGDAGRRVESVYVPGPKGHQVRWLRDEAEDVFLAEGAAPVSQERADELAELFDDLLRRGVNRFEDVRRALAEKLRPAEAG